jgi:hypothetical protein
VAERKLKKLMEDGIFTDCIICFSYNCNRSRRNQNTVESAIKKHMLFAKE